MMRPVLTETVPGSGETRRLAIIQRPVTCSVHVLGSRYRYKQRESSSSILRRRRCTGCSSSASGRDLALSVTCSFDKLQNPAANNIRYSSALEEFVSAAVLAYECGCTHDMLVEEILSRGRNSGGNERKEKEKERSRMEEVEHLEGLIEVGLVFLVMKTNTKGKRWSTASKGGTGTAVSQEFEKHWIGFVKLISNAYFLKRMAWFPLDRLQLEQMASRGKVDPTPILAERSRIVFTTLQMIAPQFPKA